MKMLNIYIFHERKSLYIMLQVSFRNGNDNLAKVKQLLGMAIDPVVKYCPGSCSTQYDLHIDDVNEAIHY